MMVSVRASSSRCCPENNGVLAFLALEMLHFSVRLVFHWNVDRSDSVQISFQILNVTVYFYELFWASQNLPKVVILAVFQGHRINAI